MSPATRHGWALLLGILVACGPALFAASSSPTIPVRELRGTRAAAATLIVQGIEGGSLPFAAIALPEGAVELDGSSKVRLPIEVEVPASLPVPAGSGLELYLYALGSDDSVVGHRGVGLTLPEGGGAGLRVVTHLDLPAGTYSLRYLLLEPHSHRFGLASERLEVGATVALGVPRLLDGCPAWSVAATTTDAPSGAAARPVLVRDRTIALSSALSPALAAADPPAIRARLTPTSSEDRKPSVLKTRLVEPSSGEGRLELELDLPRLGRGVWELRLEAPGDGSDLVSPPADVWVVDAADLNGPESDPCARTWSAVLARAARDPAAPPLAAAPAPTLPDPNTESARRFEKRRLKSAYQQVLAGLAATSDVDAGARELCRVEESFGAEMQYLPALQRAEVEVARQLIERESEVLAPLMLLHHQAYLEHRQLRQYPLAGHSARVVRELGELLVGHPGRAEIRTLASRILTSLAEHGHRNRSFIPGQRLLEVALDVEPDNPEALKLLAVNYEWFGRYEDAEAVLERLVELTASDREARLRLGILLQRAGETETAERHLRRTVAEAAQPWVLSLAYQALATLLLDAERFEQAATLLEEGRSRLPDDQRLYILGGHALERLGRFAEARRLFEELPIDDTRGSPRLRYGDSMTAPLEDLRDDILRAAAVRMPLLGPALGKSVDRRGAR